jgi:hypothetical protein
VPPEPPEPCGTVRIEAGYSGTYGVRASSAVRDSSSRARRHCRAPPSGRVRRLGGRFPSVEEPHAAKPDHVRECLTPDPLVVVADDIPAVHSAHSSTSARSPDAAGG